MKIILLSGGSGTRLWPLASDDHPKQFLQLQLNGSNRKESMVQLIWRQLSRYNLQDSIYFSTLAKYNHFIHMQIGEKVNLINEPSKNDTFAAVLYTSLYLREVHNVDLNETVIVMPVDQVFEDSFIDKVISMDNVLDESGCDLGLIGVSPENCSTKYGYIVPDTNNIEANAFSIVQAFIEKPNVTRAEELINSGALWNCGVTAFKLKFMLDIIFEHNYPNSIFNLTNRYKDVEKTSIDYKVLQKMYKKAVVEYTGRWKDLGTWDSLSQEIQVSHSHGKVSVSNSTNTFVMNEMKVPVTIKGISNAVIIISPQGILISENERTRGCNRRWN